MFHTYISEIITFFKQLQLSLKKKIIYLFAHHIRQSKECFYNNV